MKIAPVADVKAKLSAYLDDVQDGPVVVTRNGKAVAMLVALNDDEDLERLMLAHSPRFQALIARSHRQIDKSGGIPHEEFWKKFLPKKSPRPAKGRTKKQ